MTAAPYSAPLGSAPLSSAPLGFAPLDSGTIGSARVGDQCSGPLDDARRHHARHELAQAAEGYARALAGNPHSQAALLGLSLLARQSHQSGAALQMAQAALGCCAAASPPAALAFAHVGHCLYALGRTEEAEATFRQALSTGQLTSRGAKDADWQGLAGNGGTLQPVGGLLRLAWVQASIGLGELLTATNRAGDAVLQYQRAIAFEPSLIAGHYGLGNGLAILGKFEKALASFETAVGLAPASPECYFALGFMRGKLGQTLAAVTAYRRAVELRPGFASAWLNLGVTLIADGRGQFAEACYRQAIAALASGRTGDAVAEKLGMQTRISAYLNLGHLARSRRDFVVAAEHYGAALGLAGEGSDPASARRTEILVAYGYLHLEQGAFKLARESLALAEAAQAATGSQNGEIASAQNPSGQMTNAEVANARGILLLAEHSATFADNSDPEKVLEAIVAFEQAESLGHKNAASNRGNALLRLGRCAEARDAHQAALDLDPYHPGVRYNLALTQLRMGDFKRGWKNYEDRWAFREVHPAPRRFNRPQWRGEAVVIQEPELVLFLHAEQGLGDTIQFLRYLPLVAERLAGRDSKDGGLGRPGRTILLEVQPPVARLVSQYLEELEAADRESLSSNSMPNAKKDLEPGLRTRLVRVGEAIQDCSFTHHCPLLSLPAVFQTTLRSVPRAPAGGDGYLNADSRIVAERARELSAFEHWEKRRLRVGLAWAGNPQYRSDFERSTLLNTFLPLLEIPEICWISLQKGRSAEQILELAPELRPLDGCSQDRDLADTAALIANLDLVISTDTVIAHLAGALGKPLWLLLPWQSDWRWMQNRTTTPWYPTARLFRQRRPNDWAEVVSRVAAELLAKLRNTPEKRPHIKLKGGRSEQRRGLPCDTTDRRL